MRTKTLLLTAALVAAGVASSMAQVYSVNAVGYINLTIPSGFSIIANQLNAAPDNKVSTVFGNPPNATTLYLFNNASGSYDIVTYVDFLGVWDNPDKIVAPGTGIFIFNGGAPYNITLVGEVPQGTLTVPVPTGFNLVASKVPQAGLLQTQLGYVPSSEGGSDVVYRFNNATSSYDIYTYIGFLGQWDTEPAPKVGEGFFLYRSGASSNWTRNFTVN